VAGALLSVGCDHYDQLPNLNGAERDAKAIFDLLLGSALYDSAISALLLSPTLIEVRRALDGIARVSDLTLLTVFFAGHGASKHGTYYTCVRDSNVDRLSTTALSIVELFALTGELRPKQVNFVIDACQAGAAMFDMYALMKPEIIGYAQSSSIAFLAAAAANQYAGENASGGIATSALTEYLDGTKQVQTNRPYLDLIEVGAAVSRDVRQKELGQHPVAWGLNLFGEGVVAPNPHYATETTIPHAVSGIAPVSDVGIRLQKHSEQLWEEYRLVASDHDPRRLLRTLSVVRGTLDEVSYGHFLTGYGTTLAARGLKCEDLFAPSEALAVCAVSLLSSSSTTALKSLFTQKREVDRALLEALVTALQDNQFALVGRLNALSEFHYLPIRISKLLSWLALSRMQDQIAGREPDDGRLAGEYLNQVFRLYGQSIVAVSDDQAAWVHAFTTWADRLGWASQAQELADRMFVSLIKSSGKVLRHAASGKAAFDLTIARAGIVDTIELGVLANPTDLLPVLLLAGARYGLTDDWNRKLKRLDGLTVNLYVPDDYTGFGEHYVPQGNNYMWRVGHHFWTIEEFTELYLANVAPHVNKAGDRLSESERMLCAFAAHLFPDRVSYLSGPNVTALS
jgi:hypothetical protein